MTDYLEGALPVDRREAFELHLSYCDGCVNYLDQMRTTIRLSGALIEEALPPDLQSELLRAFRGLGR